MMVGINDLLRRVSFEETETGLEKFRNSIMRAIA